jgi:hypothetical protein
MEITGCDLVIFTTVAPRDVFARVFAAILSRWPQALVDATSGDIRAEAIADFPVDRLPEETGHLIFFRDAAMVRHMDEEAYAPMDDGDGPFAVVTRIRKSVDFEVAGINELFAEDHRTSIASPPEPYQAWICSPRIIEVTVITPADPLVNGFSSWILRKVRRCCST